jgi:hypothetical protein
MKLFTDWTPRERVVLALSAVALGISVFALSGGTSATAQRQLIRSNDIAKNAIESVNIGKASVEASDLGFYWVFSDAVTVGPGNIGATGASCKGKDRVVSGGHQFFPQGSTAQGGLEVESEIPIYNEPFPDRWQVQAFNGNAQPAFLSAIAGCVNE